MILFRVFMILLIVGFSAASLAKVQAMSLGTHFVLHLITPQAAVDLSCDNHYDTITCIQK